MDACLVVCVEMLRGISASDVEWLDKMLNGLG